MTPEKRLDQIEPLMALPTTQNLGQSALPEQPTTQPLERFKGYADAPDGTTKNKYICYKTHDIDHSINLLIRMAKAGWKIRAAYHVFTDSRSVKIDHHAKNVGLI